MPNRDVRVEVEKRSAVLGPAQAKEEVGKLLAGEMKVDVLARGDRNTVNLGGGESPLA
jgi:hypothetical protein